MQNFNFSQSIAFAVFKGEPEIDQRLNSDLNYGTLINRFHPQFQWISTSRNFEKSIEISNLRKKIADRGKDQDIIFLDWLSRTCINFLRTDSAHLLILDTSLAIPEEFELMLINSIVRLNSLTEALSIWPITPLVVQPAPESPDMLENASSISRLAFLLTRQGAKKIVSHFDQKPCGDFEDLLLHVNLLCQTIAEASVGRPFVFVDLELSQRRFAANGTKAIHQPENLLKPTSLTSSNRTPKVQAYISHWFSTWDSIDEVEFACKDFGYPTTVLNTTSLEKFGWCNGIPISFFRQVEYACNNFDQNNDFLLFITADVKSNNWIELFYEAERILSLKGVGSFSPTLSHEWYLIGKGSNYYFEEGVALAIVPTNDIIVCYIHKSVVSQMKHFFQYFASHPGSFDPYVGFSVSILMNKIIHSLNLFNLRSRRHTLMHPHSKSYDLDEAIKEYEPFRKIQDDFFASRILVPGSPTAEMNSHVSLQEMIDAIQWL